MQRSPGEVIQPRAAIEQQYNAMAWCHCFTQRCAGELPLLANTPSVVRSVFQHIGAKDDPRHRVERRRRPDRAELLETAQEVRNIEQMRADAIAPARKPVSDLER